MGAATSWVLPVLAQSALGCGSYDAAAVERYIHEASAQWAESVATSDSSVLERILAEDFVWVLEGRILDKATAVAEARQGPGPFRSNRLDRVDIRFFGATAVAQGSESWTTASGERGRFVWTATWVCRNDRWQVVASQDIALPAE